MPALRRIGLVAALVLAACALNAAQSPEPLFQEMLTGDQKLLQPGYLVGNIAIGDPRVCNFRVMPERRTVLLVAMGEGHTTLTIFDQQGAKRDEVSIDVVSREFVKLRDDLKALVVAYPAVQVASLGRKLTLTGTVATGEQLKDVQRIAGAAGVATLVTVAGSDAAIAPPRPATPVVPTPGPFPIPAPAAPRAPGAFPPATATGSVSVTSRPSPSPTIAVPPGAATPVPLSTGPGGASTPTSLGTTASAAPRSIDYAIELIQSPASAPPPDVLGPLGTSLFKTRLSVPIGATVRQFVSAGGGAALPRDAAAAAALVGLSLGVHAELEADGRVRTSLVVDTNLPVGRAAPAGPPAWRRGLLELVIAKGQSAYVTEPDLEAAFSRGVGASDVIGRSATPASASDAPAAVDALGAMFKRGGDPRSPGPRVGDSVLVIVVTPVEAGQERRR